MAQSQKEAIMEKFSNYSKLRFSLSRDVDYKFEKVFKFWKRNSGDINTLIKKNQFNLDDFRTIKKAFKVLFKNYLNSLKHQEVLDFDSLDFEFKQDEKKASFESETISIDPTFEEICKSYISLCLKYNEKFDEYLRVFDPDTAYSKKIKALSVIRFYNGSMYEYEYIFRDICQLLSDAMDLDDSEKNEKDCIRIVIEYLEKAFKIVYSRSEFIEAYGTKKFIEKLNNNEQFLEWFSQYEDEYYDYMKEFNEDNNSLLEVDGFHKIIKEIIEKENERTGKNFTIKDIKKEFDDLFSKYYELEPEFKKLDKDYKALDEGYAQIICAQEGYYNKIGYYLSEYFYSENVFDEIVENLNNLSNENWLKKYTHIGMHNASENEMNELKEKLDKKFNLEFEVLPVPEELSKLNEIEDKILSSQKEVGGQRISKRYDLKELAISIIWKIYSLYNSNIYDLSARNGNKLISEKDNSKPEKPSTKTKEDKKIDEDKMDIEKARESINSLESSIRCYKENLEYYFNKNLELRKEIKGLKELLKSNKILSSDDESEKDKRSKYNIIVVGGSDNSNIAFNEVLENKKFRENVELEYNLTKKQFTLIGDYKKQQDKKRVKGIENKLANNENTLIIALQTDHETPFVNLIKSGNYSSKITLIGEDYIERRVKQKFTHLNFDRAIGRALSKFEVKNDNDLIGIVDIENPS